jgi:hypothetical protein
MPTKSVFPFLTTAELTLRTETALPVLRDTISRKDNASSLNQTTPSLLTPDAEFGTGRTKNAFPALNGGSSTLKVPVFLFLTNAALTLRMETVPHASRVMT